MRGFNLLSSSFCGLEFLAHPRTVGEQHIFSCFTSDILLDKNKSGSTTSYTEKNMLPKLEAVICKHAGTRWLLEIY